jgi:hypothetical protein
VLLVVETPAVFSLPLLFCTVAVFDGAVRLFMFGETFALVSTTPFLVAPPLFDAVSPPQAAESPASASANRRAEVRLIFFLPCLLLQILSAA